MYLWRISATQGENSVKTYWAWPHSKATLEERTFIKPWCRWLMKGKLTSRPLPIATDGAPAMTGMAKRAVERLKEHLPDLLPYHCIIHQSMFCAALRKECSDVMETIMKLVNYRRASSALQHRLLWRFLTEVRCLLQKPFVFYCIVTTSILFIFAWICTSIHRKTAEETLLVKKKTKKRGMIMKKKF